MREEASDEEYDDAMVVKRKIRHRHTQPPSNNNCTAADE
jgi:hypothetical protein